MKIFILKIRDHLIGFLIGVFTTAAVTVFAASNPWSLGSLFTDIGGGIYKLIGTNIKDGSITPVQIGFNGGLGTTSIPTFKGIFSTNKSEFGNTVSNYLPSGGNWNYTLQLNGNDNTSIGFHDAGASVSSIKYWPTGFEIWGNDGWGVKQVSVPWGIRFSDGTVQTSAPVIPTNVSQLTNDSMYITKADFITLYAVEKKNELCLNKGGTLASGKCRFNGTARHQNSCSDIQINKSPIIDAITCGPWDTINVSCKTDLIAQKMWFTQGTIVSENKVWWAWESTSCGGGLGTIFTIDLY